jgi:hypothetical protein
LIVLGGAHGITVIASPIGISLNLPLIAAQNLYITSSERRNT